MKSKLLIDYNLLMKKMIAPFIVMLVAFVPFSCSGVEITPHPITITDSDKCPAACENLRRLGCEEAKSIDVGTKCVSGQNCPLGQYCDVGTCHATCDQFCRETQSQGVFLDPTCVMNITDCKQVDGCPANIRK